MINIPKVLSMFSLKKPFHLGLKFLQSHLDNSQFILQNILLLKIQHIISAHTKHYPLVIVKHVNLSNDSELDPSLCTVNQEIFTELLGVKHCEEGKGTMMNKQTPYSHVAYSAVENKNIGK